MTLKQPIKSRSQVDVWVMSIISELKPHLHINLVPQFYFLSGKLTVLLRVFSDFFSDWPFQEQFTQLTDSLTTTNVLHSSYYL
ncbi:unnamed protein product [Trichobilharzia szidati]|nr:unnamed protein product [Trichobilharzia szidati]